MKLALALIGGLSLGAAFAAAWTAIFSALPLWAIVALVMLIVAVAVIDP